MEERLSLTQQQKLHQGLSPLQVQYVKLLEMNDSELEEEVRKELDLNPALEVVDEKDTDDPKHTEEEFNESADELQMADYGSEDEIPGYRLSQPNDKAGDRYFEPHSSDGDISLMDWLMDQLVQMKMTPRDLEIARHIVGDIDDNGYMTRSLRAIEDELAITAGIDVSAEEVKSVWEKVRHLEPAGVGAVDLRDCILLQLEREPVDEQSVQDAIEIARHYFDLFSSMKYDKLQSATGFSRERLKNAVDEIKSLNPKPGAAYSANGEAEMRAAHIIPDFIIESEGDTLQLTMPNSIESLQVEQSFADADVTIAPKTSRQDAAARTFIKSKRDEAQDFIKAVKMRRETLWRIMTAIMRIQREFFVTGDELKLKPMILKDVANATGYDISVVSRATSGKYVEANHRLYPLKFFFNERLKEDSDISNIEIMNKLKELIEKEDKKHPLTDDALTVAMKEAGYDIARRTISKYREKAGIPVARLRKQL